jgi:hypothetical protein
MQSIWLSITLPANQSINQSIKKNNDISLSYTCFYPFYLINHNFTC